MEKCFIDTCYGIALLCTMQGLGRYWPPYWRSRLFSSWRGWQCCFCRGPGHFRGCWWSLAAVGTRASTPFPENPSLFCLLSSGPWLIAPENRRRSKVFPSLTQNWGRFAWFKKSGPNKLGAISFLRRPSVSTKRNKCIFLSTPAGAYWCH